MASKPDFHEPICMSCGHIGERPPPPARSCCPERDTTCLWEILEAVEPIVKEHRRRQMARRAVREMSLNRKVEE